MRTGGCAIFGLVARAATFALTWPANNPENSASRQKTPKKPGFLGVLEVGRGVSWEFSVKQNVTRQIPRLTHRHAGSISKVTPGAIRACSSAAS